MALPVGQPTIIEHLQEHIENIRMRFFDLVEEHNLIGPASHRFRQLRHPPRIRHNPAERRSGAQPHASPCTPTCRCGSCAFSSSNRNSASALVNSVLPTPVGPEKHERTDRAVRILQARARAPHGGRYGLDRLLLADDALAQARLPSAGVFPFRPRAFCRHGTPVQRETTCATSSP